MKINVTPEAQAQATAERTPQAHFLKCWPTAWAAIKSGAKRFEVRVDDREPRYETGDVVVLREYNPSLEQFTETGWATFSIGHIQRGEPTPDGICAFALEKASAKQKRIAMDAAQNGTGSK